MAGTTSAIDYLTAQRPPRAESVNVLFGDEPYLKHSALRAFTASNLSGQDAELGLSRCDSSKLAWSDVLDELATLSLFGDGNRLVILEDADGFVSDYRNKIEEYVKKPTSDGILVFTVCTWDKRTRLYKQLDKTGLQIDCKRPTDKQLMVWLQQRSKETFGFKLPAESAREMVEIVGSEVGLLDQELEKLSLAGSWDRPPTPADIQERTGSWRTKTAWNMLDAACDGDLSEALKQLERLIHAGQHPVAILGQIATALRRFALATRIYRRTEKQRRRVPLRSALEAAGVGRYYVGDAERRLKRLGSHRAGDLYRWLLEADLAMKGSSSEQLRARIVLEQLLVRIAVRRDVTVGLSPQMPSLIRLG